MGTGFLNANRRPLKNHEIISVFYDKPPTYNPQKSEGKPYTTKRGRNSDCYRFCETVVTRNNGDRYPKTILKANSETGLHPTQKPVPLLEYLIKTYTNPGETVLDNCMGSGSTGVACIHTGRDFIGMELDDHYYQVARDRIMGEIRRAQDGAGN